MFGNKTLLSHLEKSSNVSISSAIFAEWNMNIPQNFAKIGNYRYRPTSSSIYQTILSSYDKYDTGNFYTGATDADITIDGGIDDDDQPLPFTPPKEQTKLLFSLEECFNKFRPRSGINKAKYFADRYFHYSDKDMAKRPRYYVATKGDAFKYWTSDRTEDGIRGVSYPVRVGNFTNYFIDDAAPFIVYSESVPANRIVVKMQTHIGTINKGPFLSPAGTTLADPFYGQENSKTPTKWRIQYLDENDTWVDAAVFLPTDKRIDGTPIVGPDGYVEVYYGAIIPSEYSSIFNYKRSFVSAQMIPLSPDVGSAYLVKSSATDPGRFYIYTSSGYQSFAAKYGWSLSQTEVLDFRNTVDATASSEYFVDPLSGKKNYSKYQHIKGIRVVVDQMNTTNSSFDLIEMSPRLVLDFTGMVESCNVTKSMSDLGNAGMPVGQLLASVGSLSMFDYNEVFNENNKTSVISKYLDQIIKFMIYERITDKSGNQYLVPIKFMYSANKPSLSATTRDLSIELRDLTFWFEQSMSPELFMVDVSMSVAISTLLDSIGFSNYKFLRMDGEKDLIIPYFYTSSEQSVMEVLQDIAVSTQSAIFLDEENNLIVMSKDYLLPSSSLPRATDMILSGEKTNLIDANIEDIAVQESKVFNGGTINYQEKYIQRSYGSIKQSSMIDRNKTWIYKPALLWEASGSLNTKSQNGQLTNQSAYSLAAIPLNSTLSATIPSVVNGSIINNIIDFGEGVYFTTRYNGYFFANGEIIRYDAVEYSMTGQAAPVWIQSTQEYSNYFQQLKFGGTMYPTGRVRIYCEPKYEVVNGVTRFKDGAVNKHGRGQFGTPIVAHEAGLSSVWTNSDGANPTRGCKMSFSELISFDEATAQTKSKSLSTGAAGVANSTVVSASRSGIIRNSLSGNYKTDAQINQLKITEVGTVQSSALVFNGPNFTTDVKATDHISYIPKNLNRTYSHFGTRMRIIGRAENGTNKLQTPTGSMGYYQDGKVGGASGGLAVMLNSATNNGYYFEIMALTGDTVLGEEDVILNNVVFYKIKSDSSGNAVPVRLWSGIANIVVDSGNFAGQSRTNTQENPSVYDLAIEYEEVDKRSTRRFYLYINNKCVAIIDDTDPLPAYQNIAPFIRGTSRVMFENIYALAKKYSVDAAGSLSTPINSVFGDSSVDVSESMRKYALSGAVQKTYLSDINGQQGPGYDMYFEEFGTIMREAAYFNIKFDKAYPALSAKISPTFNKVKGYTVSGFMPNAYGAEFLVFNHTDSVISLDETTGNYLRIQGVTFTQNSDRKLTLDDYYKYNSDLSNVDYVVSGTNSPFKAEKEFFDIKASRATYGTNEFSLNAKYIQTEDAARDLMGWVISKTIKPRKSVGMNVFAGSVLQLGDIVQIFWTDDDGTDQLFDRNKKFVVYSIDYTISPTGPTSTIYVSEVI
jgi:hypothetical protein